MKKVVLLLTTLSVLAFAGGKCGHDAGKCGAGKCGAQKSQVAKKAPKPSKPFLIMGKLPHYTGLVKLFWDDEDFALTPDQKKKLMVVRKDTMSGVKPLGKQINRLENEVVHAVLNGKSPKSLQAKVDKIAALKAKATQIHLACIYNTQNILTKAQLELIAD